MKVYVTCYFGEGDPYFDFAYSKGPHIEIELDMLPVVGARFDLTPSELESMIQQFKAHEWIHGETVETYPGSGVMVPLIDEIDDIIESCDIVDKIFFTYHYETKERYVLIQLKENY